MADVPAAEIRDLLNLVVPRIPHCPLNLVKQACAETARRFFTETRCWLESVAITTTTDKVYTIGRTSGTDVIGLTERPTLDEVSIEYTLLNRDKIELPYAPETGQTLAFEAILAPWISIVDMPAALLNAFADAIVAGTLARLMRQRSTPWYSDEWKLFEQDYRMAVGDASFRHGQEDAYLARNVLLPGGW